MKAIKKGRKRGRKFQSLLYFSNILKSLIHAPPCNTVHFPAAQFSLSPYYPNL